MGCFNQTILYNDAAFRALFPAYANVTNYPEILIQAYWDTASLYINPNYARMIGGFTLAQQTQCLNLMTAHLVYLFNLINTNQTPGIITQATIDKVSVSLQPPPEVNQWQWWLNQSPYGQQLLALLQVVSAGGFYVNSAPAGLVSVSAGFHEAMPKTQRSNAGAFKVILDGLKALDGVQGRVGWFPSAQYPDGTPVAYAMALNEFGHGKTPPRPTGRITVSENKSSWRDLSLSASRQTIQGKISAYEAVSRLTQKAENDWKKTILDLHSPALSPVTIELRAMKKRDPNLKVTAATVGEAARRVKQPGYRTPDVNTKPLIDTGFAIATLTHVVEVA